MATDLSELQELRKSDPGAFNRRVAEMMGYTFPMCCHESDDDPPLCVFAEEFAGNQADCSVYVRGEDHRKCNSLHFPEPENYAEDPATDYAVLQWVRTQSAEFQRRTAYCVWDLANSRLPFNRDLFDLFTVYEAGDYSVAALAAFEAMKGMRNETR
jgi:hypothetical protein